jgi:peptide/nickel transport system substrate-binding protein
LRRWSLLLLLLAVSCGRCRSVSSVDAAPPLSRAWLDGTVEPETGTPKRGGTLVVRSMVEPVTLNGIEGATSRDTWTLRITRNLVTESLIAIDPKALALVPQLAERWSDSDDHRTSTFWLRKDVRFHDGSQFTAKDVIATFDAVMDPKRPTGAVRQDFGGLGSFRAIDDFTVELTWREPSPFALRQVAKLPMLSATQLAGDWSVMAKAPLGTGPYRVEGWEKGVQVTLARVGEAWVDRLVFRFVKDHTVAAAMLERGEFDLMTTVQPVLWRALEEPKNAWAQTGYRRFVSVDNSYSYIAWNEARPVFQDVKVRRGLAHLYPSELVQRSVDLGLESPTTCPYWANGPQCDPQVKPYALSVEAARGFFADAGFVGDGTRVREGVPLSFSFLVPATSVRLGKLVPLFQEQARSAGADVRIETVDVATLNARVNARDFDVVSRVWTESDLESDQFGTFHSSARDGGSNFVGYESAEADRLMEAIRREWDEPKRRELERALHRTLFADQPYLFMTSRRSLDLAKRRVHGLEPSLVWYDLRRVWVDD